MKNIIKNPVWAVIIRNSTDVEMPSKTYYFKHQDEAEQLMKGIIQLDESVKQVQLVQVMQWHEGDRA